MFKQPNENPEWKPAIWRQLDPGTAMFGISVWMFCNAFSFIASHDLESRPIMFYVRQLGLSDETWAIIMMVNAVMLFGSLVTRCNLVLRVSIGIMSFVVWVLFGAATVAAGLRYHTYPVPGTFDVIVGFACVFSLAQWAMNEDHE